MIMNEIPLTPDNQQFNMVINNAAFRLKILWRERYWVMDMLDGEDNVIISGIPLITGANLLAQYPALKFGFALVVICDDPAQALPTKTDLGVASHLYIISE